MHFKIIFLIIVSAAIANACSAPGNTNQEKTDNNKYVNTFIGTGGHGHTFPGATTPHGMVQLSPDTRTLGWDACGGYHYTDSSIIGFSHTHLSGTGISDLGDFLFMPITGDVKLSSGTAEMPDSGYRSRFSHDEEEASPGYYSVHLKDYNIDVELSAAPRSAMHKYHYNGGDAKLLIDLVHNIYPDRDPGHQFKIISDTEIAGYKHSGGWATEQEIFFHAKFNTPFTVVIYDNGAAVSNPDSIISSKHLKAVLNFDENAEEIIAKVGISSVDYNGAKNNLETEIPHWDFDKVKIAAKNLWTDQLNKIQVEGG
ncbi:MAG TPA: glycoside hydrolase domain-containing protein, partial [Prolixibacteraceae bacterium]|nr:glycoside hydrolase domain-containing protein [Prolixibacteraceae bacterium]